MKYPVLFDDVKKKLRVKMQIFSSRIAQVKKKKTSFTRVQSTFFDLGPHFKSNPECVAVDEINTLCMGNPSQMS